METNVVFLNIGRIDYDHKMDLSDLPGNVTFYEDTKPEELYSRVQEADIIVTKEYVLTREMIQRFPKRVKLICEAGTGYNNIDLKACKEADIMVCNTPAYSTRRVAHTVILLLLMLASSMKRQQQMLDQKDHRNFTQHMMVDHEEVNGKTLGIIGEGAIGKEVIRIAQVLDMKILVYTQHPKQSIGVAYTDFEHVLKESDYLSLHCALNEDTYHLIDENALKLMKPSAFLINTARGALIDEEALIQALNEKRIAGAGLDVQEMEPPRENHPFYEMSNVVLTPHMGWRGLQTRQRLIDLLSETLNAFMDGSPIRIVSK